MYDKQIYVRFNDIHLLFLISAFLLFNVLFIIDCIIFFVCFYIFCVCFYSSLYAGTYIKEHLRYLKCCLRGANKF